MPGRVLLDSTIVVALLRGDSSLKARLEGSEEVFTNIIALGELYYGVCRSSRSEENRAELDRLVETLAVLSCNRRTAEVYARLKDDLRKKGTPIPDNDLWIAATAVQHGLQLAHRDDHFKGIDQLDHVRW